MTLRFGTDGVRGRAGSELTPELALALGRAAARILCPERGAESPAEGPTAFVVGRDTRRSGPMLQFALAAGLTAEGVDVLDVGVLPTPAVAAVAARDRIPGAVISASHNPFPDNGIKLFSRGGRKLDDAVEQRIEDLLDALVGGTVTGGSGSGDGVGALTADPDGASSWYRTRLVSVLEGRRLDGLTVVLDTGNGAASAVAGPAFEAAGAEVVALLSAAPDGKNINLACGSTDTTALAAAVVGHGADLGLAFDGDADRVIAVDEHGQEVDGDRLLVLFGQDLRSRDLLVGDTVVVTVMTNLGFHRAMEAAGISVQATAVGDRHVLAALDANGWALGGEQSGHLLFPRWATTGDGILSGLFLADLLVRSGGGLAALAAGAMERFPQILRNVPVARRDALAGAAAVWAEVAEVETGLRGEGRVLLRPSGTEPLVRVMVEAPDEAAATGAVERLVAIVRRELGDLPAG